MYSGAVISMKTTSDNISEFSITIDLHQDYALNLYLFALVVDKLYRHIQDDIFWYMLFMDYILLLDKMNIGVNYELELYMRSLESKSF